MPIRLTLLYVAGAAIIVGIVVGLGLVAYRDVTALTPQETEIAKSKHNAEDLNAWSTAIAEGRQWEGTTPYVPPKPSWPVAHPWFSGFVASCIAALVAWIVLLMVSGGSPSPGPSAGRLPASDPDRPPTPPVLYLVPDTSTRRSPRTPAG